MITKQKQIERKKQIAAAAKSFFDKIYDYEGFLDALDQAVETAFIAGAVFSDESPRPGLVEIEDVEDIYMAWLRERECFMDYLKGRCIKAGWL